ncbi:MAG: hypothetical protein KGS44_16695, partial [Alphaproteobacteria bacterium]|nr:hypothetical protein [Alphaproteobacteria bacterium]
AVEGSVAKNTPLAQSGMVCLGAPLFIDFQLLDAIFKHYKPDRNRPKPTKTDQNRRSNGA